MYNSYFGFSESPFENNLDQRFFFMCEDHREVLAALMYFVLERKGLALVCGDVGTGKTMLINSFLARLPDSIQPILISNPLVSYLDLLHFIANSLGIRDKQENTLELLDQIKEVLIAARRQEKDVVLIVDEAHLFPDANLEQVRLLSNIEIPAGKLLQVLLVGQNELSHNLNRPEMRQLRQRINISRFLSPLTSPETVAYIDYRLQRVGSSFQACFEPNCEPLLYQLTAGVPRRLNQLCDNALLSCMTDGLKKVNHRVLEKANEALLTDVIFAPQVKSNNAKSTWNQPKLLVPLAACAAFLIIGIILGRNDFRQYYYKDRPGKNQLESIQPSSPQVPPVTSIPTEKVPAPAGLAESTEMPQEKPAFEVRTNAPELKISRVNPAIPGLQEQSKSRPMPREPESGLTSAQISSSLPRADKTPEPAEKQASSPQKLTGVAEAEIQPPAGSARPPSTQLPRQVGVKAGDTLTRIAADSYPKNVELGLEAILLANPETINVDLISPGQKLTLPLINTDDQTILLRENQFYAGYGRYFSMPTMQKTLSRLSQQGVRYLVINTRNNQGNVTHRVLIGSYESRGELEKALKRLKARS
jgi:general secretion pathway protein A